MRALGHAQLDGRAFPCGLLHDVGMVLLDGTLAEQGVCMPPEAEADRIRDSLAEQGIELLDGPEGTGWSIAD